MYLLSLWWFWIKEDSIFIMNNGLVSDIRDTVQGVDYYIGMIKSCVTKDKDVINNKEMADMIKGCPHQQ